MLANNDDDNAHRTTPLLGHDLSVAYLTEKLTQLHIAIEIDFYSPFVCARARAQPPPWDTSNR